MTLQFSCTLNIASPTFQVCICNCVCAFEKDSGGHAFSRPNWKLQEECHLLHCGKHANHPSLLPNLSDICWADWTLTLTSKAVSLTALQRSEDKHKGDNNLNVFRLALYQLATGTTVGTLTTAGFRSFVLNSQTAFHLKKNNPLWGENGFGIHCQTIITLSCTCCWSNFTLNFCQAVNFSWAALCNVYYNCLL